jgi:oligopeptide transport system ATP-binding protein
MTQLPRLLEVRNLTKTFPVGGVFSRQHGVVRAVDQVSFDIARGEVLALVGESGSGKTTVGHTVLRLTEPNGGNIRFDGQDITHLSRRALRPVRRHMQIVFQDPFASLNPRMNVERILAGPLIVHRPEFNRAARRALAEDMLRTVGLFPAAADRFPHEFSGGQRQRIGIARALMLHPALLIADEPVSALDVSVQAQIVNLLMDLRQRLDLAILFIAHDLAVVGTIADRVAVMYLGRIVELADTTELFVTPRHPYTEALFSAVPQVEFRARRSRIILSGDLPSPLVPTSGCAFRTRCRYALSACAREVPPLRAVGREHWTACIRNDIALTPALEREIA